MAHAGSSGLQAHSIGPIYPWTIVVTNSTCYAMHCGTGETKPAFTFSSFGESFKKAHEQAEMSACGSNLYDFAWDNGNYFRTNKITKVREMFIGRISATGQWKKWQLVAA